MALLGVTPTGALGKVCLKASFVDVADLDAVSEPMAMGFSAPISLSGGVC